MDKRQKRILIEFVVVIGLTVIAVVAMIYFRNLVNHSEAMRAMEHLGRIVVEYRKGQGSVPSQSYIDSNKNQLEGYPRLGDLQYRALCIDFESGPDEILAYSEKDYGSWFIGKGYIVLRLDGTVQWLDKHECEAILKKQQGRKELEMLKEKQMETSGWEPHE
jgi:hypothetical protein